MAIAIGSVIINTLQGWCFGVMGCRLARRVRVMFLDAVLRQEQGWFDSPENNSGEVMSRLSTDVSALRGAVGDAVGAAAQNIAMVIIGLTIAFTARYAACFHTTAAQLGVPGASSPTNASSPGAVLSPPQLEHLAGLPGGAAAHDLQPARAGGPVPGQL